ncbi:ubinuclein-1 isoform X2 [Anopheles moucheti]|uniref:ubinuclein-1 isoform X2 n=1 Tax=Anopheles moucheti TaxID=186751 RepID=UPI0022F01E24|nr:ubinuclein-1 isoform X2 [Anopheles moucheti]
MSDIKRAIGDAVKKGGGGALSASECSAASATLNPFGNSDKDGRGDRSNSGANGSGGGGRAGKKLPTVRLELNLFEPTAESFPEFNFSKLIHDEQKRLKKAQKKQNDRTTNGFLSDPDIDVEVERISQELERKYGMGTEYASKGKAACPSKLDYYDRGAGYDEEDSFIDNSEAYDELIPQEVETVGGGFYINSGQLEFKQLSNFERPEDAQRMPKPKKRVLSTSSESSEDDEPGGAKKKPTQSVPAVQQAQKQPTEKSATPADSQQNRPQTAENDKGNLVVTVNNAPTATPEEEKSRLNGHVAKKQKMADNGPVAPVDQKTKPSIVGEGGKEKANGVKGKSSTGTGTVAGATTAGSNVDGNKKEENGGVKELKTTTVKDMLRAKRDSLRKMEQEKKGRSSGSSRVSSSEAEEDGDGGGDEEDEEEENGEGDDEDEDEEEEYDEQEVGSDKKSRASGSDVELVSDSGSSHESEKDTGARGKVIQSVSSAATNGMVGSDGRTVLVPSGQQPAKERKQKDCKLPDDIPEQLRNDVDALKEHARSLSGSGKLNFFESKVADLLLRIDDTARSSTSSSTRNAVLRHVEAQLSISRQSLQLKLKKIRIRKLENKTKSVLSKLEDTIAETMPAVLAKYQLDCMKVADLRAAAAAAQQATTTQPNGEKNDAQPNPTTQIRNPKKKYLWNERSRTLLWELYNIRQEMFELMRPRNQTEDEVVAEYMRTKVVPLWLKGWVRYEDIHKELDRRKKALAKGQGSSPVVVGTHNSTGKKSSPTVSPLVSPVSSVDAALLTGNSVNGMKPQDVYTPARSSTPSSVKSTNSKGGGMVEAAERVGSVSNATHHSPNTVQQPNSTTCMSPNSSYKRTSDHSIINIMNSPPPPADKQSSEQRRSLDAVDQSVDGFKRSPMTPASINLSPAERKLPLPSPDRQRWNSREDDSDSSIEIIAEYNVPRTGTATPFQSGAGSKISASSPVIQTAPAPPLPSASNLPVLNKEKYKNLIAGKHKTHGGSGSSAGSSPITAGDTISPIMSSGKYAKHAPGGHGHVAPGGVIGFAAPSGNVSGSLGLLPEMTGAGGGGSVRLKDTPPPVDVDVHQIMKDLKEFQELQKQHNVSGGNRKSDSTSLQSQQQHAAATSSTVATAASSNVVADYFIDCDMDEDDILFATNYTYSGGHKH